MFIFKVYRGILRDKNANPSVADAPALYSSRACAKAQWRDCYKGEGDRKATSLKGLSVCHKVADCRRSNSKNSSAAP